MAAVVEKNGRIEGEAITNPCVIVEVLSDSTERDDRSWKFRDHRTLPSLEEYVLVSQTARRIEVHRRKAGWQADVAGATETVTIHGATLSVDATYDPRRVAGRATRASPLRQRTAWARMRSACGHTSGAWLSPR